MRSIIAFVLILTFELSYAQCQDPIEDFMNEFDGIIDSVDWEHASSEEFGAVLSKFKLACEKIPSPRKLEQLVAKCSTRNPTRLYFLFILLRPDPFIVGDYGFPVVLSSTESESIFKQLVIRCVVDDDFMTYLSHYSAFIAQLWLPTIGSKVDDRNRLLPYLGYLLDPPNTIGRWGNSLRAIIYADIFQMPNWKEHIQNDTFDTTQLHRELLKFLFTNRFQVDEWRYKAKNPITPTITTLEDALRNAEDFVATLPDLNIQKSPFPNDEKRFQRMFATNVDTLWLSNVRDADRLK